MKLRGSCDSGIPNDFDPVFDLFVDKGFIVQSSDAAGTAPLFKLAQQTQCPPP